MSINIRQFVFAVFFETRRTERKADADKASEQAKAFDQIVGQRSRRVPPRLGLQQQDGPRRQVDLGPP